MKDFEDVTSLRSEYDVEDYQDAPYYEQLKKLPEILALKCLQRIEKADMSDTEANEYVAEQVERRREAITVSVVSDEGFGERIKDGERAFFDSLEEELFDDNDKQIGHGRTAKVHECSVGKEDDEIEVAVKYLISPLQDTQTVDSEHNIIKEVERIEYIEKMEKELNQVSKQIKVPHPYFHHSNDKIQCYGMQRIKGCDLERGQKKTVDQEVLDKIKASGLDKLDLDEFDKEIDAFFEVMHRYCLHGDIKPANIMVGPRGNFYIIDFGQSRLMSDERMTDKEQDRIENLKADEVRITKSAVRSFIRKLYEDEPVAT